MSRRRKAAICSAKAAASLEQTRTLIESGQLRGPVLDKIADMSDQFGDQLNRAAIEGNGDDAGED